MGPSIDALAQSQDGYLWCRTRSGLFRFDDVKFTRFSNRVQRAMDVRLVLRQGLRYALARNGIRVLQILLTVVVVSTAATLLAGDHTDRPQKIIVSGWLAGRGGLVLELAGCEVARSWEHGRCSRTVPTSIWPMANGTMPRENPCSQRRVGVDIRARWPCQVSVLR